MYAARIDTVLYTFEASGSLWQDALVLRDQQTGSLWSQITGECIKGTSEGKTLTLYPSFTTTFREFKELYPAGQMLVKPERGPSGSVYDSYMRDPEKLGIFGRIDNFKRVPAKSRIYGLRLESGPLAISGELLSKKGTIVLKKTDPPVIVTFDPKSRTATAFALSPSEVPNPSKVKVKNARITIEGGQDSWNARTGRREQGDGPDLKAVPLLSAYWFAWASFFPRTELLK